MSTFEETRGIIGNVLQLGERAKQLEASSTLMGGIPEFDSMAVVTLITALEEHFSIEVEDDEISADMFATVGTVADFVEEKIAG